MSPSSVKCFLFLHNSRLVTKTFCRLSHVDLFYATWKEAALYYSAVLVEHRLSSSHFALSGFFLSQVIQEMMRLIARSLTGATLLHSHACVDENIPINNISETYSLQSLRSQTIQCLLHWYSIRKWQKLCEFL